jgi:hypothetical protein
LKRPKNIFNNLLVVSKKAEFSVDFTSLEIVQKLANKVIDKKAKEKSVYEFGLQLFCNFFNGI